MSLGFLWGTGWSWKWIHVPIAMFLAWLAVWIFRASAVRTPERPQAQASVRSDDARATAERAG